MAHAANNRHTDNWWLETIASAVTQDGSGNGTLAVTISGSGSSVAYATVAATTLQSAATATGNGSTINTTGMSTMLLTVSGITSATIVVEGVGPAGNYNALRVKMHGTNTIASSITSDGVYEINVAGFTSVRARISAYTSGTITATALATAAPNKSGVQPTALNEQLDAVNDAISSWEKGWTYTQLTASGQVSSTACLFAGFTCEASSSGTVTMYDNTAASGTVVGFNAASVSANTLYLLNKPIVMTTGVYASLAGTSRTISVLTRSIGK